MSNIPESYIVDVRLLCSSMVEPLYPTIVGAPNATRTLLPSYPFFLFPFLSFRCSFLSFNVSGSMASVYMLSLSCRIQHDGMALRGLLRLPHVVSPCRCFWPKGILPLGGGINTDTDVCAGCGWKKWLLSTTPKIFFCAFTHQLKIRMLFFLFDQNL